MAEETVKAYFSTQFARFNWCRDQKEWQLWLDATLPDGERVCISETFGEDASEPEANCPSEAFDLIEERSKSLWIDTARADKEAKRNKIRPHLKLLNFVWAKKRAEELRRQAGVLEYEYCMEEE